MINKANKKIREDRETVVRKVMNGVSDYGTYRQLIGEYRALCRALEINLEVSKLDEDDDDNN
jgi:hypothetical protein